MGSRLQCGDEALDKVFPIYLFYFNNIYLIEMFTNYMIYLIA
jgi:hypothetical protein